MRFQIGSDVTIIGAGPAGSIASLLLARQGWDVTLIEQHRFPRDKVCGECLSALAIEVLSRAGLAQQIREQQKPAALRRVRLVSTNGRELHLDLPHPMWGLTRHILDTTLLQEAAFAGAQIHQPARCERIEPGPRVTIRDLSSNRISQHSPKYLLIADGKSSKLSGDLGLKAHFSGVDESPNTISLFGLDGHYVGLAPVGGETWNLAMSVPAAKVKRFRGDGDRIFEQILRENRGLERRMRHATRIGNWLASPLPRCGVQRNWPRGVIPIGNAAAALEPIGGEGMGLAMRSAELVAQELIAAQREGRPYHPARLRQQMRQMWDIRSAACRMGGLMLSSPAASNWVRRMARPLAPMALRLVGK